jgi:integrase
MDAEGQEERINMTAKVAPVVLDKEGKPKPPSPEVRRKAKEIVEQSGANSKQYFNRVVIGEVAFRKQAEVYLLWAKTRDREPIKDTSSIEAALNKWILPSIGDLSLGSVNNITVKPLVDKMKKSLSARSVNTYVEYIQQIVASLKDGETGEPIHRRKWDSSVMDLPLVNSKQQRRPSLKAQAVAQLVRESEGEEQALYVLAAATGMRISEALALEGKHFINNRLTETRLVSSAISKPTRRRAKSTCVRTSQSSCEHLSTARMGCCSRPVTAHHTCTTTSGPGG